MGPKRKQPETPSITRSSRSKGGAPEPPTTPEVMQLTPTPTSRSNKRKALAVSPEILDKFDDDIEELDGDSQTASEVQDIAELEKPVSKRIANTARNVRQNAPGRQIALPYWRGPSEHESGLVASQSGPWRDADRSCWVLTLVYVGY